MRAPLVLILPLALAACGTPQTACISRATKDLRVVNALVAETELNLARGYSIRKEPAVTTGLELCISPDEDPFLFCARDEVTIKQTPVAINPTEERAKLAGLRAKQAELDALAARQITQCKAQFPEG